MVPKPMTLDDLEQPLLTPLHKLEELKKRSHLNSENLVKKSLSVVEKLRKWKMNYIAGCNGYVH